tara:strand:+ start:22190 stop:27610 length:5421 start_codon:yes stop_codon:yes gene_type:complete
MYINLIISVVIILIIFILINKKNKEKFSVQSDTEFANDYCNTYCERRDHNYDDGFGTKEQCNDKCKENINLNINTLKKGSTQALSNLFNIDLIKQIGAKDDTIRRQATEISKFEEESILKSNVDGIKALGYISEDDCTFEPTTELCAIAKTDIGDKKSIKTQSENGEQSWGLIGTSANEYGKIGTNPGEYGKIGSTAGEYGKIGTNLGEYMSVNQCRTAKSANDADIRSQCTVENASDKNSYITKQDADVEKQNAISEAENKVREELADGCVVEIAKNRNDFMRVDDCVLTPKKYAEATRTLGTDNKFTITTPNVAGKKWVEMSEEYKDKIQVKRFVNSELENYLIEKYNPIDKSQYNVDYTIELDDDKLSNINNLGDLLYSDYVEIEIELDGGGTIKKYFKPVKNDDGGGIDKEWGLIGVNDNQYILRGTAKTLNWCEIVDPGSGEECKPNNYIDPTKCTFDMLNDTEKLNYIQSDDCSIKKTDLKNFIDATTPPAILSLPYNDGTPESADINSSWGKIYPDDVQNENDKNGYYGKIGTESNNYMIRSNCSVTSTEIDDWMEKSQCALTHSQKDQDLGVNDNGPLNVIKKVGGTETESWGKIGTINGKYGKIGSDNGDYGVIGTDPEQYMLNSDCGINTNTITGDSKLITAKNGSKWGKVSDDDQGANEGIDGYYGVIGDYNSEDSQSNNKYMKNSECAISTDSIDGNGPITTRDGSSNWGKISAEPGTEGTSTYYGKIGTEDNDYIKNFICNSQKDDHLYTHCKLTKSDFNTQISTTPNEITIDTESSWGRIGSGNGEYGKIGGDTGEYMINANCHTLQSGVDTNNTATAKDQTYWGKIGENAGGDHGGAGYYGLIGDGQGFYGKIGSEDNDYVKNTDCAIYQSQTSGNGPVRTRDGSSEWGKISDTDGGGTTGYYGEIGNIDDPYKYMLNDNCHTLKDRVVGNTATAKDETYWGKIGEDVGGTNHGVAGYYGKIGTTSQEYIKNNQADTNTQRLINDSCELLKSDVNGGTDNLGISSITNRTWGKVSEDYLLGTNEGKQGYYGEIRNYDSSDSQTNSKYMKNSDCAISTDSIVDNGPITTRDGSSNWGKISDGSDTIGNSGFYGLIGDYNSSDSESQNRYMKNSKCAIEVKDLNGVNLVSAKDTSEWGKVKNSDGNGFGNPGNYGEIGDENDKYMLYQNCELLKSDVSGGIDNLGISTITHRTWGKVNESNGNGYGFNGYYGKIGDGLGNNEYGLIGNDGTDYMIRGKCLYDDNQPEVPGKIITLKNIQNREWGEIAKDGDDDEDKYISVGDANQKNLDQANYIRNNECEFTITNEDTYLNDGKNGREWGRIGQGDGKYMENNNCKLTTYQFDQQQPATSKKIQIDSDYWGKIYHDDTHVEQQKIGYYGKIGSGSGDYGKIGDIDGEYGEIGTYQSDGTNYDKYMKNSDCAIEVKDLNGENLVSAKDTSQWGKVSDNGRNQGKGGYYGKIGDGSGDNEYGLISDGDGNYMKRANCLYEDNKPEVPGKIITLKNIRNREWGEIGIAPGDYGQIGTKSTQYMLNDNCHTLESGVSLSDNTATAKNNTKWGKVSDDLSGRSQGKEGYYGLIGGSDSEYMLNQDCAISTDSIDGEGPITTRDGSSSWGKVRDQYREEGTVGNYGRIGNTAGDYIPIEVISELESTIQTFDDIEIKNIDLNELLLEYDSSNKTIISGWVSGNIISGDTSSVITVFAYKCEKVNNKIYKDSSQSLSILKLFKGRITQCVVDSVDGSKRYIYFKDNKEALQRGFINLSKQLGDDWTNENIGNNIECDSSQLGCIEIEKKT